MSLDKPIDKFIEEEKHSQFKTRRDVIISLLTESLSAKSEARRFVDIPPE